MPIISDDDLTILKSAREQMRFLSDLSMSANNVQTTGDALYYQFSSLLDQVAGVVNNIENAETKRGLPPTP